jgi:hypothetical protein
MVTWWNLYISLVFMFCAGIALYAITDALRPISGQGPAQH